MNTQHTKTERYDERLAVKLTREEVMDRGMRLAREHHALANTKTEQRESNAYFKQRTEGHTKEISALSLAVERGEELRMIEVEKAMHYDLGEVTITRLDTGHIIETRSMTRLERQMKMEI